MAISLICHYDPIPVRLIPPSVKHLPTQVVSLGLQRENRDPRFSCTHTETT